MENAIAVHDGYNPMALLQTAIEKGMDPDKLGRLMDLQERWEASRAAERFALAVTKFQGIMPAVTKGQPVVNNRGETMYYFADFADLMEMAQPYLNECGIAVTFSTTTNGNLMETTCHVRVGTHVEHTSISLPMPAIPNANAAQMAGAALSYGQRYSLKAALNIRIKGEDNDGDLGSDVITAENVKTIKGLLAECEQAGNPVNMDRFLDWVRVDKIADIAAKDLGKVLDHLTRKRKEAKK